MSSQANSHGSFTRDGRHTTSSGQAPLAWTPARPTKVLPMPGESNTNIPRLRTISRAASTWWDISTRPPMTPTFASAAASRALCAVASA